MKLINFLSSRNNNMYYFIYILAFGLLSTGCKKVHNEPAPADLKWSKIVIKNEYFVSAIYKNNNGQIIAGTNQNIVRTADSGNTSIVVARNVNQIREFVNVKDTLFAIADWFDYYSLNDGISWQVLDYDKISVNKSQIASNDKYMFKLVHNSNGELTTPTDVLMSEDNGRSWRNIYPYKNDITSVYVDNQNKIYLGMSGRVWDNNTGWFVEPNNPSDAIIYYSVINKE